MKKLIIILILLLVAAGSYYYINYNNTQVTSETYEYIKIEKGNIKKTISATGKGTTGGVGTDVTVTATPTVHYGKIALGYKF